MALRLIEVIVRSDRADALRALLQEHPAVDGWEESIRDGKVAITLLVGAGRTGPLVDDLDEQFGYDRGFRLVMLPVEAALPRPPEPEAPSQTEASGAPAGRPPAEPPAPIIRGLSREELRNDVVDMARLSGINLAMVASSTCVAAVGMLRDSVAIIIGAM